MSKVALIVAMDQEGGIGRDNDLMWHLPADMKFFKETTTGHVVITGRKNYDSIPERFRPLPNRENAVLTRNDHYEAPGAKVFPSLGACLEHYENDPRKIFIIGGGQIYKEALEAGIIDEMYVTHVDGVFGADTFFPEIDPVKWEYETIFVQEKDEKHEVGFETRRYA